MSSITRWNRLEPVPRAPDLTEGLRAELADPLWLLARQFQFGELSGEDAGSAVESVVTVECAPVTRLHAGSPVGGVASRSVDLTGTALPLEPLVEQRPVSSSPGDVRLRAEAGLHFLRLLSVHRAGPQRRAFLAAYPMAAAAGAGDDPGAGAWLATVVGRVPDGRRLAEDLLAHRGAAPALRSLPADPAVPDASRDRVLAAANAYLAWWESSVLEPPAGTDAWDPRRLEYRFAVEASLSDGNIVLRADDYRGGRLDWFEFEADTRASLGRPAAGVAPRQLVRRALPSRAFYGGMPAERYWEFEDATVRFAGASVGRTDLAHMLLNEFALAYGNDWFVVPLTVPVGSVCAVRDLRVRDSFGLETVVGRSAAAGAGVWSMFELSRRSGAANRAAGLFFLVPAVGISQEGDPVEEVAWFRDELANLVWAVERRTESATGRHVDRYEVVQRRTAAAGPQRLPGDVGDATLIYRLSSTVPENWFPLVPVRPPGAPAGVLELELRPIEQVDPGGAARTVMPSGRFLTAADPLVVEEEEIGRDGVVSQAHWQLTRGTDGRYLLWLSNRVRSGTGEGSSSLVFDVTRPVA